MTRLFSIFVLLAGFTTLTFAQTGYDIKVKLANFSENELYLGYHLADKQYIQDTVQQNAEGYFNFKGEEALAGGMYLVVMPPDNQYFQIVLNEGEQQFTIETDAAAPAKNMKITGSPDNKLFYEYLSYLDVKRPESDALNNQLKAAQEAGTDAPEVRQQLEQLNADVKAYQLTIIEEQPTTMTAAIIKANLPYDMPEFEGEGQDLQMKQWRWMQKHYFDNLSMDDARLLRTPFLFQRVDNFVNKMVVQHPDTISLAVDRVLEAVRPAEETYKYFLIHFLNNYASSKIIGQDAVYVHIAEKYYATGQAPWTEEEQLEKIIDNATRLKPLLIGKTAPDIEMEKQDGSKIALHQVQSPYTVLIFWQPDCGHCKESMPEIKTFYEAYKDKGVEIFAVCTKTWERDEDGNITLKEIQKCWDFIDEKEIGGWINVADPYVRSRFSTKYDIKSTPQIYILDKDKGIVSKRLGAEQLDEVMGKIIEADQKAQEEGVGMNNK